MLNVALTQMRQRNELKFFFELPAGEVLQKPWFNHKNYLSLLYHLNLLCEFNVHEFIFICFTLFFEP